MQNQEEITSALNLCSRMPPSKQKKNLIGLISLAPELEQQLLQRIDLPLEIEKPEQQQPFLKTQFNREGDSYRSPFSNKYYPDTQGYTPSGHLRRIQQVGAILFKEYTKLYYGGDVVSNFFVSAGESKDFLSCGFFAKKNCQQTDGFAGNWDSFNIVDIVCQGEKATYKITSTVLVQMKINDEICGNIDLTGFLKKQKLIVKDISANEQQKYDQHLIVVGQLVEELQTTLRQYLQSVYIARTKQIIFNCRMEQTVQVQDHKKRLAQEMRKIHLGKNRNAE